MDKKENVVVIEEDKSVVAVKFNPALYLADELLEALRNGACTLLDDEEYKTHFNALYNRVQQMLDIGEWIELRDFYYVIEKVVRKEK